MQFDLDQSLIFYSLLVANYLCFQNLTEIFSSLNPNILFECVPGGYFKNHAVIYTSIIDVKSLVQHILYCPVMKTYVPLYIRCLLNSLSSSFIWIF